MAMDPINKKMMIKKVAGFQPFCTFDFLFSPVGDRDRSGFGTRDFKRMSRRRMRCRVFLRQMREVFRTNAAVVELALKARVEARLGSSWLT